MKGEEKIERYVVRCSRPRPKSLHGFMTSRVGPLLTRGWSVKDVRVLDPADEPNDGCALEVVLEQGDSRRELSQSAEG